MRVKSHKNWAQLEHTKQRAVQLELVTEEMMPEEFHKAPSYDCRINLLSEGSCCLK